MNSIKYVGLDVHQSTISVAVLEGQGNLVMQCVLATRPAFRTLLFHQLVCPLIGPVSRPILMPLAEHNSG